MDLDRIEIFAVGTWNGQDFSEDDLDEMVRGFEDEQQSGRLPVKLGHTAADNEPARGWLSKVWREGGRLLARIEQVPDEVYNGIKSGAWRHVSVELVRDLRTASGRSYRWLLDGLALLGSARPAVDVLTPLDQSLNCSAPGVRFAARHAFTLSLGDRNESAALHRENERLRARLHRQSVDAAIEGDVRARVVMPAAREQFRRLFKLTDDDASYSRISPSDWHAFRATQPRPPSNGAATHAADWGGTAPDATLVAMTRQYVADNAIRHLQLTGERLTFDRAAVLVAREVARSNPTLLRAYADQPGEAD